MVASLFDQLIGGDSDGLPSVPFISIQRRANGTGCHLSCRLCILPENLHVSSALISFMRRCGLSTAAPHAVKYWSCYYHQHHINILPFVSLPHPHSIFLSIQCTCDLIIFRWVLSIPSVRRVTQPLNARWIELCNIFMCLPVESLLFAIVIIVDQLIDK
jgi:hypothetical protein